MKPVRLFTSTIPSGNVYKVELLLAQLGVVVDTVPLDILANPSETRRPDFLAKNPNGRVPVLELSDGSFLSESNAILCFLAEGTEFMPRDAFARARVLEWLFFEQYSHEPYVAVLKFWTYRGESLARPRALGTPPRRDQFTSLGTLTRQ
jgi:glutathione S-transferase